MRKVVTTFAGTGGSSYGYKLAGCKCLLAIEWEKNAVENYKLNFPNTKVWQADIRNVSSESVLEKINLKAGELDIFDGSPPCQGFSTAGKREANDNRNFLFEDYIRLLRGLQPKAFVMENVSGMVKANMRYIFGKIVNELRASNYNVAVSLLNSANYNVPQNRQRVIFIGFRNDLKIKASMPIGSSRPISSQKAFVQLEQSQKKELKDILLKLWEKTTPGDSFQKANKQLFGKSSYYTYSKLHPLKPSPTIIKTSSLFHFSEPRYLTIAELKRLQTLPDNFILKGSFSQQWARIGNSVPPNLMKAVAEHVCKQLDKAGV